MRKPVCLLLSVLIFLAGCAGREANPIPVYLPGDNERSCEVLVAEMAQLQADMQRLLPKTNKGVTNALWATAGVFLIVPFFFMDLKDAEKIEFEAMRTRHNRLLLICADKRCNMTGVRAERIYSAKEAKAMAKKGELANAPVTGNSQPDNTPYEDTNPSSTKTVEIIVGATKCTQCGRDIGEDETFHLYKLKRVCPECFRELTK